MCMCRECNECSKASYCNGLIIEIFNSIENDAHKFLLYMAKQYMPVVLKDRIEKDEEIIYDIYNISRQNLVHTAFFEFTYDWMLHKPPFKSYAHWLKAKYKNEKFEDNLGNNALYKKRVRYFKRAADIKNMSENDFMQCNYDFFDLHEFIFNYRFNRHWRDASNEDTEHKRIFEKDIFKYMYGYTLPSDNNYRVPELRNELKKINKIYEDIQNSEVSYFTKCLYYSIVEYFLHYETTYRFVSYLNKYCSDIKGKDKKIVLFNEALLRSGKTEDGVLIEYPFLLEKENFIARFFNEYLFNQEYAETDTRPTGVSKCLMHLSIVVNKSIESTKGNFRHELKCLTDFHISDCGFAENVFKSYIGEGQHIEKEKNLDDFVVNDIMEIYRNAKLVDGEVTYITRNSQMDVPEQR